jgi:hypothetical protein
VGVVRRGTPGICTGPLTPEQKKKFEKWKLDDEMYNWIFCHTQHPIEQKLAGFNLDSISSHFNVLNMPISTTAPIDGIAQ